MALYGKMPSVTYQDYPEAEADHPVGREPVRVRHPSHPVRARGAEARREAGRDRPAHDAAGALGGRAPRRSGPAPTSPSRWRSIAICSRTAMPTRRFCASTRRGAGPLRERAEPWTFEQAAEVAGVDAVGARAASPSCTPRARRRSIRCGWGLERNRNGGNAAMAVLALPAVGGKFGVRGGGYSMSNSASWNIDRPWIDAHEPDTRIVNMNHLGRALTEYTDPPVNVLFVYNCNPAATVPDQRRIITRPRARGSVHRRLRAGDDRHGAVRRRRAAEHDVPRGLRFRERLRPDQPRPGAAGHRRRRRSAIERRRVRRAVHAARAARRRTSRPASSI